MSFLTKKRGLLLIFVVPALLYIGYELFLTRKLSPPADSERITVSFRVPEGVTLLPLGGLYTSSECTDTGLTPGGHFDQSEATTGVSLPFVRQGAGNLMSVSIAKDGGGRCQWKLRSLFVRFKLSDSVALTKGGESLPLSYLFDFLGKTSDSMYSVGSAQDFKGDLRLDTDFFPVVVNLPDEKTTLRLFGGDVNNYKWSRHFRLYDTQRIFIKPILHTSKSVTVTPSSKLGYFSAVYPDGSSEDIPYIFPDYEKLLSMK